MPHRKTFPFRLFANRNVVSASGEHYREKAALDICGEYYSPMEIIGKLSTNFSAMWISVSAIGDFLFEVQNLAARVTAPCLVCSGPSFLESCWGLWPPPPLQMKPATLSCVLQTTWGGARSTWRRSWLTTEDMPAWMVCPSLPRWSWHTRSQKWWLCWRRSLLVWWRWAPSATVPSSSGMAVSATIARCCHSCSPASYLMFSAPPVRDSCTHTHKHTRCLHWRVLCESAYSLCNYLSNNHN